MPAAPTRTLNPLPFQDLEPHRFEDLVRQLAYDLRRWKSLEAVGRGGSDDGLDIRATEIVAADPSDDDEQDGAWTPHAVGEHLWIFQCKREKTLGPKHVREVVEESLISLTAPPHGFVLAIACDVSKKTRDAFREEMVARGIEEYAIWAKGELEDMLFQPKNDRLLFAYFGLSLTTRRRNLSTQLRSSIAKKKQLFAMLESKDDTYDGSDGKLVLLRDPSDDRYPTIPKVGEPQARWLVCRAISLKNPDSLTVLRREHLAAVTPDVEKWDAILDCDVFEQLAEGDLRSRNAWGYADKEPNRRTPHGFWNECIAEEDRAFLKIYRTVPLDRVLALDPLGDGYFPVPHILIDFDETNGPFDAGEIAVLDRPSHHAAAFDLRPSRDNRTEIFPKALPAEDDPIPVRFDQTSTCTLQLTDASGAKLASLLAATAAGSVPADASDQQPSGMDKTREKLRAFREWRNAVGLPVFSEVVSRLRAAGHTARVVIRTVEHGARRQEARESIELRFQLRMGITQNSYRQSGHVRLSVSEYAGWMLDVSPRRDASMSRGSPPVRQQVECMVQSQLEEEVLATLERLRDGRY